MTVPQQEPPRVRGALPAVLGRRYELGPSIGLGASAQVRIAQDLHLDRTVAVKVLHTTARESTLARFRREAQIAATFNHPAIVAVLDSGDEILDDGTHLWYTVMEHVEGRTVRDVLAGGPPPLAVTLGILEWVLAALEVAHAAQVVHRDIKPANVMITVSGVVKVMDFGIARVVGSTSPRVTQTAAVVGTARYLSPEQAAGGPVDTRADLYAVGCLAFELLTGRPPFVAPTTVTLIYQHLHAPAPVPSSLDPTIPEALDQIVATALAKDPADRYRNATLMRTAVRTAMAGANDAAVLASAR
ncbi:MAG: protein kinase [Micrococcales bacterium]|nr:protein kinase [Micrococcales bacterium]MCL2667178.1 protein kinase [Micrococcales bacterium]